MARNNIQFKGIRHSPSDITGQDGDLLECVNLIHENGELKPIEMPEQNGIKLTSGYTLAAVHNVVGDKIFVSTIVSSGDTSIQAVRETTGTPPYESVNIGSTATKTLSGEVVKWVETVGNTLIVGTDKSTHYALFKNGDYKWLGDKIPQPIFEFDFDRSAQTEQGFYVSEYQPNTHTLDDAGGSHTGGGVLLDGYATVQSSTYGTSNDPNAVIGLKVTTDENKRIFRDGVRSKVQQALGRARSHNRFVFPFFVRYAVRLFDGSYAMHSAPQLMIPSTLANPLLAMLRYFDPDSDGNPDDPNNILNGLHTTGSGQSLQKSWVAYDSVSLRPLGMKMEFVEFVDENGDSSGVDIDDWSDIVKGVDIFLSSQISSYDERAWDDLDDMPTSFKTFIYNETPGVYPEQDYGSCYTQNKKIPWFNVYDKNTGHNPDNGVFKCNDSVLVADDPDPGAPDPKPVYEYLRIDLPTVNTAEMMNRIKETNLFYMVKQYDTNELIDWVGNGARYFHVEAEDGTLDRLETLTTLPDDYVSRSRMVGGASYNYNQRLILGNLQLQSPLWYQDAKVFSSDNYSLRMHFKIEKSDKTIYVRYDKAISSGDGLGQNDFGHYIYYPDVDCKEVVVELTNSGGTLLATKKIEMNAHSGLNGAYALMPSLESLYEHYSSLSNGDLYSQSDNRYYSLPNTISMSNAANPFNFKSGNFKDIGRTKVIGIATNTLDVSYEQWGPYPILVFCNDGIVTVTIDKEGDFTGGVDAISADVLLEPQGHSQPTLVQTGQTLMFLTQRGVMLMAGTKISCVSEAMNGKHFNPLTELSPANSVLYGVGAFSSLITETSDDTDFKAFAATGFLSYDYAHNRVLLMNVGKDYQYVFSLKTGLWSKQVSYTNLASIQVDVVPGPNVRSLPTLTVVPMKAAVNNYTEMYLQDTNGYLYKTMDVANENVQNSLYQYGYFISRPIRFGTDEYKTVTRMLNRYTHYAANSFVKTALYGSRDGVRYGRVNTLRGMSYQYYIFVAYTYLKPNERYSYLSVDFETRLTNKLR